MVTCKNSYGQVSWLCNAIYASLVPSVRELLWSYVTSFSDNVDSPWLLISDFNKILRSYEVKGGVFSRHLLFWT